MIQANQTALNSTNIPHKPSTDSTDHSKGITREVITMQILNGSQAVSSSANASLDMWSLPTRSLLSTTMLLIMTVAIVGNILVITVILQNRGMRTRTNMFLCSLAISDLLCTMFDMPFSLVTVLTGNWQFHNHPFLCQLNGILMPLFFVNSTHTLMYIAIHKYVSIRYPFRVVLTERRILIMIAAAWTWGAVVSVLTATGLSTIERKVYTTQCGAAVPKEAKGYSHLALVLGTCYLVPLAVIIFCYSSLFRHIREHGDRLEMTSTTDRTVIYAQQRRILSTLFLVVIVFIVNWTPWGIYSIYLTVIQDETKAVALANPISYWFGYVNSACNPIIYAFRSEAFRDGYREALCRGNWKRFSVSQRISYNINNFRLSNSGFPWQLNIPPSISSKSLAKVAKCCNIDNRRFSTRSLPVTVLRPDNVCSTSEHPPYHAQNGHDATLETTNMTGNNNQYQTNIEGFSKTHVYVSKSCDSETTAMDQKTSEMIRPESSDIAIENDKEGLVTSLCFRPRFRTYDWTVTVRPERGINPGWRMPGAKDSRRPAGDSVRGNGDLNAFPADSCSIKIIRTEPGFQKYGSIENITEPRRDLVLPSGMQQTEASDAVPTLKNWRKRLSTKWKRHSQKTFTHKNPNCPSSEQDPSSSTSVRRSVTTKPVPRRCPSVERLDHSFEPRKRIMTEVPVTYRRRRTGVDCSVYPSATPQLDRLVKDYATGVQYESEKVQENIRRGPNERGNKERGESERPRETLNALAWATASQADCLLMSPGMDDHPLSRRDRFLSDPCESTSSPIGHESTQKSDTLNRTESGRGKKGCSV